MLAPRRAGWRTSHLAIDDVVTWGTEMPPELPQGGPFDQGTAQQEAGAGGGRPRGRRLAGGGPGGLTKGFREQPSRVGRCQRAR